MIPVNAALNINSQAMVFDRLFQQHFGQGTTPQQANLMSQSTLQPVQPVQPLQLSYKCNYLEQLQGMYEIDTPDSRERWAGPDKVHVLMPTWKNQAMGPGQMGTSGCTIVRRMASDGEGVHALADQMILEEPTRFLLASIDQEVLAYMMKGGDMQNGLTWTMVDGTTQFWARVGKVTFNFVDPNTLNRQSRNLPSLNRTFSNTSMSSVTSSIDTSTQGSAVEFPPTVPQTCYPPPAPAPAQGGLPRLTLTNSYSQQSEASSTDSYASSGPGGRESFDTHSYDPAEQMLFESIKRFCQGRPGLVKKVVHWGLHRDHAPAPVRMSPELVRKLSQGRIWVCVDKNATGPDGQKVEENELECLDDLKGAYQLDGSGCYIQPRPEANQPGTQHRVRKGADGYWMIEELSPDSDHWAPRTVEQPGGRWWDNKAQKKVRIKLVMLEHILDRLGGDYQDGNIEKQMEFLFLNCNQKKLHTKLKQRNLKHNIANLKVKLEKQHCLSFAVRIANIADSIINPLMHNNAKEFGVHTN